MDSLNPIIYKRFRHETPEDPDEESSEPPTEDTEWRKMRKLVDDVSEPNRQKAAKRVISLLHHPSIQKELVDDQNKGL